MYESFFCLGRHHKRTNCTLQSIPVHLVEELVEAEYKKIELTQQMVDELQTELILGMRERTAHLEVEVTRQRRPITKLEDERRTLLQAHLHGAISVDLLKEEQDQISRQLADAGGALAASEINWEAVETNLETALSFVTGLAEAYRRAGNATRRRMNQALFDEIRFERGESSTPGWLSPSLSC